MQINKKYFLFFVDVVKSFFLFILEREKKHIRVQWR